MELPSHKTKLVCTIGPACDSRVVLEQMIRAGMNVARINFSHGDFASHRRVIETVKAATRATGLRVAIMADLPGPKIRIGKLASEPIELNQGDELTLTTEDVVGDGNRVSVSFQALPEVVKPGDAIFLNDGYIQLQVVKIDGRETRCMVLVGGELRSRKGLNLPGIDLGIRAFTDHDGECLKCALEAGVDIVSQSFVDSAADVTAVRQACADLGKHPFIIAKIERSRALDNYDQILSAADGIMIARGDLGVETPIEEIAVVQKRLIHQANLLGKPVITATQMLESMTLNPRPTRAEATDVANAILDGTDCVMLSEESATGKYPVEAVRMLSRIAAETESTRPGLSVRQALKLCDGHHRVSIRDLISLNVATTVETLSPSAVIVPTRSGASARSVARFRLPIWITAVSSQETTCQSLTLSYGVHPVYSPEHPENWKEFARVWLRDHGLQGDLVVVTEGPSSRNPEANNRMEIIDLSGLSTKRSVPGNCLRGD